MGGWPLPFRQGRSKEAESEGAAPPQWGQLSRMPDWLRCSGLREGLLLDPGLTAEIISLAWPREGGVDYPCDTALDKWKKTNGWLFDDILRVHMTAILKRWLSSALFFLLQLLYFIKSTRSNNECSSLKLFPLCEHRCAHSCETATL